MTLKDKVPGVGRFIKYSPSILKRLEEIYKGSNFVQWTYLLVVLEDPKPWSTKADLDKQIASCGRHAMALLLEFLDQEYKEQSRSMSSSWVKATEETLSLKLMAGFFTRYQIRKAIAKLRSENLIKVKKIAPKIPTEYQLNHKEMEKRLATVFEVHTPDISQPEANDLIKKRSEASTIMQTEIASLQIEAGLQTQSVPDFWRRGTWEELIAEAQQTDPDSGQNSRGYYYNGWMRLEPTRSGADQARSHAMVASLVGLYAALAPMKLAGYVNPIIQRCQHQQAQPHLAFYIDRDLKDLPTGNAPIDLDRFDPPTLVVEVGASSFADDVGMKRLLYERLGVAEYWVVNVEARSIIGFAIADRGSREIQVSQVLPGLELSIITEALQRLDREDDGQITRWLIDQFQEKS